MKRYELVDKKDGLPVVQLNIKLNKVSVNGLAYIVTSWDGYLEEIVDKDFFADFKVKWDGCSHFQLYGQDYPYYEDSYYHICGVYNYLTYIRTLNFILEVAYLEMKDIFDEIEELMELRKFNLLEGFEIVEKKIPEYELEELNELLNK